MRPRLVGERFIAPNVRFLVMLVAMLLVVFGFLRAGLIWRTWSPDSATVGQIAWSFVTGLRFDLAISCYIAIAVAITCYIPWLAPWRGPRTRRVRVLQ
jgi:hypothetical protein